MKYSMNFGKLAARTARAKSTGKAFRIAVLGDFSGRANAGKLEKGAALAGRKPWRVDVDNLDSVVQRMGLHLHLPIAANGGTVEVKVGAMDDFHPDQLYQSVEVFRELDGLRKRLKSTATYPAAAQQMRSWLGTSAMNEPTLPRTKPRGSAVPHGKLNDFARLIGLSAASPRATPVDELIQRIVGPHVVAAPSPEQQSLVAAVDEALSAAMRRLLHCADFQSLESLWRSVELLIRTLETSAQLQIVLYDVTAEELAADLSTSDSLEETGLYSLLVEQPLVDGQLGQLSVLLGNYVFEQIPPHAELLGRIGKIAAAAQAPFIAGISADCLKRQDPQDVHPLVLESWDALRSMPHARYLGLTVPRFMLRWPYGAKTEPIDSFDFEEFTPQVGLKGLLWANGSILAGLLLGKTFSEQGLTDMRLGSMMTLKDVPFYYYTDSDGDQVALPNTERLVPESSALRAISQGLMPILCIRGRSEIRLGSFGSLGGLELAGPWSPLMIEPDEKLVAEAPPDASERVTPIADALDATVAAESEGQSSVVTAASDQDKTDELDTLLSDLSTNEVEPSADGTIIDPDLAELLDNL